MTDQTTADRHVAEARRDVHESLTLLPAWEADRVRSLIADLESAVESRTAVRMADAAPLPLPADEARMRLLQALDASYCQALGHTPEGLLAAYEASRTQTVDQAALREIAEVALAAVETALGDELVPAARAEALAGIAAVLPATTNHDTAPAATCSAQYHGPGEDRARLCIRAAQHQRTAHTDEHGFHWSDTVAMYPVADGTFRIGTDVRAELRRVADETAAGARQDGARQAVSSCLHHPERHGPEAGCIECRCTSTTGHATERQDGAQQ